MANLFIAYDLNAPEQHYHQVENAIAGLGQVIKIQYSMYYVKTSLSAVEAEKRIWLSMDTNDRLIVIDGKDAWWHNLFPGAQEFIQEHWNR